MDIIVLVAQRKVSYPGQYAPEVVASISANEHSDNPDYMDGQVKDAKDSGEFSAQAVVTLRVDDKAIEALLNPSATLHAEVVS